MAKTGRPKKSLDSLPENWQKKVLDIAQQGLQKLRSVLNWVAFPMTSGIDGSRKSQNFHEP